MRNSHRINGLSCIVCLALVACNGAETPQDVQAAGDNNVATTVQAVAVAPGIGFTWTDLGAAWAADRIAAANGDVIFAFNDDRSLWKARGRGPDLSWRWFDHPSAAIDIDVTDDGSTLYALNEPGSNWWNYGIFTSPATGDGAAWSYLKRADPAQEGTPCTIFRIDVRSNNVIDQDTWCGFEIQHNAGRTATGLETSYETYHYTYWGRLNDQWYPLPSIQPAWASQELSARDMAAADYLWVLTDAPLSGGDRHIFRGEWTELSCYDRVDNDLDGLSDSQDPDCVCSFWNRSGTFCLDRTSNQPGASQTLVACDGSTLVGTTTGTICVWVGSGGSDYLRSIQ